MKSNKILYIILSVTLIVAVVSGANYASVNKKIKPKETVKLSEITKENVSLIAHRGLSSQAPENTLPALELAAQNGHRTVEFDITLTKDGVWVLSHDSTLTRMTNKIGRVADYTFFDLAGVKINNGANYKNYEDLKIPSLDDALDACLKNGLKPMIEIKSYTDDGINKLVSSIVSHGFEGSCYVISFDRKAIDKVRAKKKNIPIVLLAEKLDDDTLEKCLEDPETGVSFKADKKNNTSEKIKKLADAEIELFCWVVDDAEMIDFYSPLGVKTFVTNRIIP
ncbi:MAG: hypothetical protein IJS90_05710 [Clostridia bacterium]|nr:hypothetical protein [Clostridia bacterium]